ncbi:hypothetical protein OR1_03366 [Geobacter sp. OR-1]|nr:hypothetical protein OR1_03366 [Geobacter sp. OR-1]
MTGKKLLVTFFGQNHVRPDWKIDTDGEAFACYFAGLQGELERFGIDIARVDNPSVTINVNSYADLLNSVRISSPADGITSQCVGHIIGKSENLDLLEDIGRAVKRVAFAPETIAPEEHNRRVCHNCGCGC